MSALKILLVGDFSGRTSRDGAEFQSLASRRHHRIDKDNFDEVFAALNVSLNIPQCEQALCFGELEDFEPDSLFMSIELFEHYRTLKRQISNPATFHLAEEVLVGENLVAGAAPSEILPQEQPVPSEGLLDSILAQPKQTSPRSMADSLIQEAIAPYIEEKQHPNSQEYLRAINSAIFDLLRSILKRPEFEELEVNWRSLDMLNRRLDTDRECALHILDASFTEIAEDLESAGEVSQSQFYESIVDRNSAMGDKYYDLILLASPLNKSQVLAGSIAHWDQLCADIGAKILIGVGFDTAESLVNDNTWANMRGKSELTNTCLVTPGLMLRLPYGTAGTYTDLKGFEELDEGNGYLWGSGAVIAVTGLMESVGARGSNTLTNFQGARLGGLPLHVVKTAADESVTPSTERYISQREVNELADQGFTVLQSVKNSDEVHLSMIRMVDG